ncbi:MAG: ABC transporter substrate-binding protein [Thermodesulfobacteriota bacterium]
MSYIKKAIRVTFLLFLLLSGTGIFQGSVWSATKIVKIGFITEETGYNFPIALSQKKALEVGLEEINSSGGFLGKKVILIIRDSGSKPEKGAALARDLILRERVDFLLGPTSSEVALAVSRVAREHKKIIGFHASNGDKLTVEQGHRYLFQVIPNTIMEGRALAAFLSQKHFNKFALIGPDNEQGQSLAQAFKKRLSELNPGVQVVREVWTKSGEEDFSFSISTIQSHPPDAIVAFLGSGDLARFLRQGRTAGLFPQVSLIGRFDYDLLKGLGTDMPPNLYGFDRAPFYALSNPQMKAFLKKFRARSGEYPSAWAVTAYDGLMALKRAVEKAKSLETEKVILALKGLQWDSLRGSLSLRPFDHQANSGIYFGLTKKDPRYSFYILKEITYSSGQDLWYTEEEIKALRK